VATKSPDSRKVSREKAVAGMRSRVARLEKQWKELADELDDHMICLRKERKKRAESLLKSELELLAQIEEVVKSSQSATDAEELSEYLDVSRFQDAFTGLTTKSSIISESRTSLGASNQC